ncbi:MAG: hypothetical protein NTY64_21935, partial [Deltaproteobacteria bacterium]|nr:hypothetical protein [Deltaproteobacteria bacterium]
MNYRDTIFWIMGKYPKKMLPAVMGNANDPVGVKAGIENPGKTPGSILFGRPLRMNQKRKIVEGINKATTAQPGGTKEIIGMDKVWISQLGGIISRRAGIPKKFGSLKSSGPLGTFKIAASGAASVGRPIGVPVG